jgi:hypothetical protein
MLGSRMSNDLQPQISVPGSSQVNASEPQLLEKPDSMLGESTRNLDDTMSNPEVDMVPVPSLPPRPETPELDGYTDKEQRKQAEKDYKHSVKAYESAVKTRDKMIKEQQKAKEKRQKKQLEEEKDAQRRLAQELRQQQQQRESQSAGGAESATPAKDPNFSPSSPSPSEQKSRRPDSTTSSFSMPPLSQQSSVMSNSDYVSSQSSSGPTADGSDGSAPPPYGQVEGVLSNDDVVASPPLQPTTSTGEDGVSKHEKNKPKKDRKFCMQPERAVSGDQFPSPDPRWVKVFMRDMDEVAAHTGLFFPGEHYEKLVGDVGATIIGWVEEDATKRVVLGMSQ